MAPPLVHARAREINQPSRPKPTVLNASDTAMRNIGAFVDAIGQPWLRPIPPASPCPSGIDSDRCWRRRSRLRTNGPKTKLSNPS